MISSAIKGAVTVPADTTEPIVGVGIHQIEGVVNAVYRILVAASKVVADEDPRYTSQRTKPVTDAKCGGPCADIVAPGGPTLTDHLEPVVEIVDLLTSQPESNGPFIESPGLGLGGRFDRDTRRHSPKKERFEDGLSNHSFDTTIDPIDVVAVQVMTDPGL